MFDKTVVTPLGRTLLERKREQLEKVILEAQEELVDLNQGSPGDGFQDGFLLDTQMNIQMLEQQLRQMTELLKDAAEVKKPQQTDVVALGHRIQLNLTYPSGESEALTVVLVPSSDRKSVV